MKNKSYKKRCFILAALLLLMALAHIDAFNHYEDQAVSMCFMEPVKVSN